MYQYKQENKTILKENVMNFSITRYLNEVSEFIKDGYRLHSFSGSVNKEGNLKISIIYEKEVVDVD